MPHISFKIKAESISTFGTNGLIFFQKLASGNMMTFYIFYLVFTSIWAKSLASAVVSTLLNHLPQYRKMVNFAKSSSPMLDIDLHPWLQQVYKH